MLIAWSPAGSKSTSWRHNKSTERYNNIGDNFEKQVCTKMSVTQNLRRWLEVFSKTVWRSRKEIVWQHFRKTASLLASLRVNDVWGEKKSPNFSFEWQKLWGDQYKGRKSGKTEEFSPEGITLRVGRKVWLDLARGQPTNFKVSHILKSSS